MSEQQPAGPFDANNLAPHDALLRWAKEFGLNVTDDVGDAFTTTGGGAPDVTAEIDGRLGMLSLVQNVIGGGESAPRGRTYLTPPWETFTEQPAFGAGIRIGVLYAHVIASQGQSVNQGGLMLAPAAMVGNQDALPFLTADVIPQLGAVPDINFSLYNTGDGGPADVVAGGQWSNDIYFRMLIATDGATSTDVVFAIAARGVGWLTMGALTLATEVVQRIGGQVVEDNGTLIDFMRLYDVREITVAEANSNFPTFLDTTGGRLFIPS